jgi:hypothetical protein
MSLVQWGKVFVIEGGIGAIGLSVLTVVIHWLLLPPSVFEDGQYAMIFLWTLPVGAFLGAITGAAMQVSFDHRYSTAGWICIGGATPLLLLVVGLLFTLVAQGQPDALKRFAGLLLFWFGSSVIWAAALVLRGILFLRMPVG